MTNASSDMVARVKDIRARMAQAAQRAGRDPASITLIGVTKTQPAEAVRELILAGVNEIGENRVQELLEKKEHLRDLPHRTHLIGNLQRNKAKFLPGHIDMLQSLDSVKTLEALEKAYGGQPRPLDVLIEVNIGDEANKTGVPVDGLEALVQRAWASPRLRLRGLMAIPPFGLGTGIRPYFQQMHHLFVDIKGKKMDNDTVNAGCPSTCEKFDILSMGMSADFELAIEEGATMVRVGTELFGPRA